MIQRKKSMYLKFIKRIQDFIVAFVALILLSPFIVIIGVLVRAKLGSPILFKQERPGLNEKVFTMYKFRTMTDEKDAQGRLLSDNERLTKFGAFLRSTSLDELPELWNILRGDMALVGPRPLLVQYLSLYDSRQKKRHSVRPGLTGLAQVSGRNAIQWEDKFEIDIHYVDKMSFWLDWKIILLTFRTVLFRKGITSKTAATMEPFTGTKKERVEL